jgi:enediyne biosynthesis protein E4
MWRAPPLHLPRYAPYLLVAVILPHGECRAQEVPQKPQQGMGGNATGGTFASIYDSQNRPITAGGFVDLGPIVFKDITKAAGLSAWSHKMGSPAKPFIIDTDGSGVALLCEGR